MVFEPIPSLAQHSILGYLRRLLNQSQGEFVCSQEALDYCGACCNSYHQTKTKAALQSDGTCYCQIRPPGRRAVVRQERPPRLLRLAQEATGSASRYLLRRPKSGDRNGGLFSPRYIASDSRNSAQHCRKCHFHTKSRRAAQCSFNERKTSIGEPANGTTLQSVTYEKTNEYALGAITHVVECWYSSDGESENGRAQVSG